MVITKRQLAAVFGRVFLWSFLLAMAVVVLYPLLWMVLSGFRTNSELFSDPFGWPNHFSWDNYAAAWNRGVKDYLVASFLVTFTSTVATVLISAWAAYGLTRVKLPLSSVWMGLILGGMMLAPSVALIPLVQMFRDLGLYNTFWALLILHTAFRVPFTTFLIRAYMVDLPLEVDEAAAIDGCSPWQTFWRVTLPMCKPIIISAVILHILFSWNEYMFAKIFTDGGDWTTLPVGLSALMSRSGTEYGVVFAGMTVAAIPVVLLFFAAQKYLIRGLSEGIGK